MPKNKLVEAANASDRARQRRNLGTLRELTVQPATKRRYNRALDEFFVFLKSNNLSLPTKKNDLDPLVCDYIEHMWSTGVGRGQANDTVAALQDQQPNIRGHLQGAWRLLKTWSVNEVPNRAPPLPEEVVMAMAGWAFFKGHYSFGISLVIGFYTMLRSGELLGLASSHIMCRPRDQQALISLGKRKEILQEIHQISQEAHHEKALFSSVTSRFFSVQVAGGCGLVFTCSKRKFLPHT